MFKTMGYCSRVYKIQHVDSTSILKYRHQWELQQKKTDDARVPDHWKKAIKNKVLYIKLVRGVRGVPLAYMVWYHIKVPHFSN